MKLSPETHPHGYYYYYGMLKHPFWYIYKDTASLVVFVTPYGMLISLDAGEVERRGRNAIPTTSATTQISTTTTTTIGSTYPLSSSFQDLPSPREKLPGLAA